MVFKCPICGAYTSGESLETNTERGTCTKCGKESTIRKWHYFDETGEAVHGTDVLMTNSSD
jgi:transcription elongation factor Elf1